MVLVRCYASGGVRRVDPDSLEHLYDEHAEALPPICCAGPEASSTPPICSPRWIAPAAARARVRPLAGLADPASTAEHDRTLGDPKQRLGGDAEGHGGDAGDREGGTEREARRRGGAGVLRRSLEHRGSDHP